jgi:glutamate dehydrogenase (NAD(P)+)
MNTATAEVQRHRTPSHGTSPRVIEVLDPSLGLEGYLAVDSVRNGIAFGGFRIDPSVTRSMVEDLSRRMSLKLAPHGSPVGGAKAGLRGSPDDPRLPLWLEVFSRRCSGELHNRTVLGKDMGASDGALAALYGCLGIPQLYVMRERVGARAAESRIRELMGYRRHMTALGIAWSTATVLGGSLRGRRVLIQGFGAVGAGTAVRLTRMGATVVGVSDRRRALYHHEGLPLQGLLYARSSDNELIPERCRFPHQVIPRDELLHRDGDVLVLAAGSYLVDRAAAEGIRCPLVAEGANMGLQEQSHGVLHQRDITVIPDVIANSSSAALVAHQLASGNALSKRVVWGGIRRAMEDAVRATLALSERSGIPTHQAFIQLYRPHDA